MISIIKHTILALLIALVSSTTWAAAWFTDGFETGDLTHTENNANWFTGNGQAATVSSTLAKSGTYSMRFEFGPSVWTEERFDLGSQKTEVYIRYYVWFDSNYTHSNPGASSNNKLIRLWSNNASYSGDSIKVGASLWYDATNKASLLLDAYETYPDNLSCAGSMDALSSWGSWKLTASDLGKWLLFEWHMKRDSGAGDGALELWIDGVKKLGYTGLTWASAPCSVGYFLTGYLFGATNASFASTTYIYVDDFTLSDTYTGTSDAPASAGSLRPGVSASGVTFR